MEVDELVVVEKEFSDTSLYQGLVLTPWLGLRDSRRVPCRVSR